MTVSTPLVALDLGGNGLVEADELAAAGGTVEAVEATSPADLVTDLQQIVTDVQNAVVIPECTAGLPRVMIILDASSSMLNDGNSYGAQGQTGWDQAREALAGSNSLFDATLPGVRPWRTCCTLGSPSTAAPGSRACSWTTGRA